MEERQGLHFQNAESAFARVQPCHRNGDSKSCSMHGAAPRFPSGTARGWPICPPNNQPL